MGFEYCSENEQYLTPLVEGLVEPCHYYGIFNAFSTPGCVAGGLLL